MKVKEFIKAVNEAEITQDYPIEDLEDLPEDLYKVWESYKPEPVAEDLDVDKHRWYEITTEVYKVVQDGATYFVGFRGVSDLFSESMSFTDAFVTLECFEMKEKNTVTYVRK